MRKIIAASAACAALAACDFSVGTGAGGNSAGNSATTAGTAAKAPAMTRFVNSRENARSDTLREHYADFSFYYPSDWTVSPQRTDGTAQNYVRVASPPVDGFEAYAVHVGSAYGSGDAERDARDFEQALPGIAEQFGSTMPNYRVASIGRGRVASYDTHNWRFSATAPSPKGGEPVQIYGRGDIILPPGATRGVLMITLATSRADDVRRPEDVGETGILKAVYDSFRLQPAADESKPAS